MTKLTQYPQLTQYSLALTVALLLFGTPKTDLRAQDTQEPTVVVEKNGSQITESVTVNSMDDLLLKIADNSDGEVITNVTVHDPDGTDQSTDVLYLNQPLGTPMVAGIGQGDQNLDIITDTCTGQTLEAHGTSGATCYIEVQTKAQQPGTFPAELYLSVGNRDVIVPFEVTSDIDWCVPEDEITGYSACSAYCGGGTRDVSWSDRCGREWVTTEACNTQVCDFYWSFGAWNTCSATCGGGEQTREAYCMRGDHVRMTEEHCDPNTRPAITQECNT
jgi:hypothetical protein